MKAMNGPLGASSQYGSLSLPGFVLDVESQAAIFVLNGLRQHWRIEQIAVERIGDEQARRQPIGRQAPRLGKKLEFTHHFYLCSAHLYVERERRRLLMC